MPTLASPDIATITIEAPRRAEKQKSKRVLEDADLSSFQLSDEKTLPKYPVLSPLNESRLGGTTLYTKLNEDFAYYEATRDLEINSERTQLLNKHAKKMLEGSDHTQAQVVIMRKGEQVQGFVYPDGTIFINQALINQLDSIDEVVAVVAHEVNHLRLKTSEKAANAGRGKELGVGWIHEMGSDLGTIRLLESCGYNSTALATAIAKISGNNRGTIHQTGNMRSSEVAAAHYGIHTDTSHIPTTPLPDSWKTDKPNPSNLEVALEAIKRSDFDKSVDPEYIFSRLHPKDLYTVHEKTGNSGNCRKILNEEIRKRLSDIRYAEGDTFLFQLEYGMTEDEKPFPQLLDKADKLVPFLEDMHSQQTKNRTSNLRHELFYRDQPITPTGKFLRYAAENLYLDTPENATKTSGVAVNEEVILKTIGLFFLHKENLPDKKSAHNSPLAHEFDIEPGLHCLIASYVHEVYIRPAKAEDRDIDNDAILKFLESAKKKGISLVSKDFKMITTSEKPLRESVKYLHDLLSDRKEEMTRERKVAVLLASMRLDQDTDELKMAPQYLKEMADDFANKNYLDETRHPIISDILQRIAEMPPLPHMMSYRSLVRGDKDAEQLILDKKREKLYQELQITTMSPEEQSINHRIRVCNLQMVTAMALYGEDSDYFYEAIHAIMQDSGLAQDLSPVELINLSAPILKQTTSSENNHNTTSKLYLLTTPVIEMQMFFDNLLVSPHNIQRIQELPFITSALQEIHRLPENASMKDLYENTKSLSESLSIFYDRSGYYEYSGVDKNLFSDSPLSLLFLSDVRKRFTESVKQEISDQDLPHFYKFIDEFLPDDPTKNKIKRKTALQTLRRDVSLQENITFLKANFDSIGPEGFIILGEKIESLLEYKLLREAMQDQIGKLFEGNTMVTLAAETDFATSLVSGEFDHLLAMSLSNPQASRKISTDFAAGWLQKYIDSGLFRSATGVEKYLPDENLFAVNAGGRQTFRSISDIFETLHDLPQGQRFAILWKAFQDQDGAFSSPANRELLADFTTKTLGLKDGFVSQLLSIICKNGDMNAVTPPLASSLSSYLFSGLQTDAIQVEDMLKSNNPINSPLLVSKHSYGNRLDESISLEQAKDLTKLPTRKIVALGLPYRAYQDKTGVEMAQAVKDSYYEAYDMLEAIANPEETMLIEKESTAPVHEVKDQAIEALIRGIQSSGAVGVRAMQLAVQFDLGLSEDVITRLSESFDSNPGLPKIFLWENLYEMQRKAQAGNTTYKEVSYFLDSVTIQEKLGGGSLYSTYAALLKEPGRAEREIVIKSLNPNALMMIKTFHTVASDGLQKLKTEHPENAGMAATLQTLVDLSQEWCIADIMDPTFERDDDAFAPFIARFNQQVGQNVLSAPDRVFNHFLLKAEDRAKGRTLNAVLKDSTIPFEQKREATYTVLDFFATQLEHPAVQFADESGKKMKHYLLLSDPNPGNMMIDHTGKTTKGTVIDRSMYLKLTDKQMNSIRNLHKGDYDAFTTDFFFAICEANKVRSLFDQLRLGKEIRSSLKQKIGGQSFAKADPLRLIQIAMQEFEQRNLTIPLDYRLAVKNVFALQTLRNRFTTKQEEAN